MTRFSAHPDIAYWWKTATTGGIPKNELPKIHRLFSHEYIEHSLEKAGLPYRIWDENGYAIIGDSAHDLAPRIGLNALIANLSLILLSIFYLKSKFLNQ